MKENENNFESLRRLLALKRRETPPPGYFHNFSGEVISRIRSGGLKESSSMAEAPWIYKLMRVFEAKPAFGGAFASALCLLLVFGIVYAERPDGASQSFFQAQSSSGMSLAAVSPEAVSSVGGDQTGMLISTNAGMSLQPVASLFGSRNLFAQQMNAQQVNFSIPGN